MNPTARERRIAALAAAVLGGEAERIAARGAGALGTRAAALACQLALRPREERLASLAAELEAPPPRPGCGGLPSWLRRSLPRPVSGRAANARAGTRTPLRTVAAQGQAERNRPRWHAAWKATGRMPLPFPLPAISRGFALLTPGARAAGIAAAEAISSSVARHLSVAAHVVGRPLAAPFASSPGAARIALALEEPPGFAVLEVDVAFLARVLARLAGATAPIPAALEASDAERGLLDLLALVALDAVTAGPAAACARLSEADGEPVAGSLALALELEIAGERGTGRLAVPAATVAALGRGADAFAPAAAGLGVGASLREGTCTCSADDVAALAPGDVLVLDGGAPRAALVLPGGLALEGRLDHGLFHVQEIRMTETQAAFPITVAVEIARVTVTLGELARLEPGAALPLDVRRDGVVVLRAGERVLARGQLVDVEGAIGVRVVELGAAP